MKDKFMKILFFIIALVIVIVAIIKAQNPKEDKNKTTDIAENKTYIDELRIGISAMDTFDPILSYNKNVQDVNKLIYDSLITVDENYKIKGLLAEEWAETMEKTYIIKLKQNIKLSNGNIFTAKDVEHSINKIKKASDSIYKDNVKNIASVTIIDEYTIKIELIESEAFFEYNLIFPIQSLESDDIGTGFYKVYQKNGNRIELTRNLYNEKADSIKIKTLIIKNYGTMGELYNDFKIGNLDIINTDNIEYSSYIGTLGYTEKNFYGRNFDFLAFNMKNTTLYNAEVRKAISYAIDKNAILSNIYNNKYYNANYPLDYGSWLYNDNNTSLGYNPEQSKNILKANGWELIDEVWRKDSVALEFNLIVNSQDSQRVATAESIKQQLSSIGIKINVVLAGDLNPYISSGNYDLALLELKTSIAPDLSRLFGKNNIFNYFNQDVEQIIEEIKYITDENVLKEKYAKILEVYKADLPFISLYYSSSILIYNSKIAGNITPTWYNLFYNIENWVIEE